MSTPPMALIYVNCPCVRVNPCHISNVPNIFVCTVTIRVPNSNIAHVYFPHVRALTFDGRIGLHIWTLG